MKKELVISIIIIILIIIGNIVTQSYTKECISKMNEELEKLKDISLNAESKEEIKQKEGQVSDEIRNSKIEKKEEKNEEISKKIDEIEKTWNEYQEKLAYYIEHDELEKVESQIFTIKGFSEVERYDEIVPELEKCVFILQHIQDKTKINIKNIF